MNIGLQNAISSDSGVGIEKCYQCGKCTAGCPLAGDMDFAPSYVIRMLQSHDKGLEDQVLRSRSIWLCLTCDMCVSRCPMEIDIPRLMDYLRGRSLKEKKASAAASRSIAVHKSFLDTIIRNGRLYEVELEARYKLRTLTLMQDLLLVPGMLSRGKLNLMPERIRNRKALADLYRNTVIKANKKE